VSENLLPAEKATYIAVNAEKETSLKGTCILYVSRSLPSIQMAQISTGQAGTKTDGNEKLALI
jgi:hypothetical protein